MARAADRPGHARVPQARALGQRGAPPALPPRLPPDPGQARRPLRPAGGVRPRERPRPAAPARVPHLLGLAPDPGAGGEGPLLQGALPPLAAGDPLGDRSPAEEEVLVRIELAAPDRRLVEELSCRAVLDLEPGLAQPLGQVLAVDADVVLLTEGDHPVER